MADERTTPRQAGEETPQAGTADGGTPGAEPERQAEESVEEKIARLEKAAAEAGTLRKRVDDAQSEITRRQQEAADHRKRAEAMEAYIREQQSRSREADPEAAAKRRFAEADAAFDTAGKLAAMDELLSIREQRSARRILEQGIEARRLERTVEELAGDFGAFDADDVARRLDSLSPSDRVRGLMLLEAERSGKLPEIVQSRERRRTDEAARASAVNALLGNGSAGRVPGGDGAARTVPYVQWQLLNEETRKRLADAGYQVAPI